MRTTEAPSPADRGSGSNDLLGLAPERAAAAERCLAEWQSVNDPPCHPGDADWRPCRRCEHAEHSAEWFAARVEEVRRDMGTWPRWMLNCLDWAAARWPK